MLLSTLKVIHCYLILQRISPFGQILTYTLGTIISCFFASFSFLKKVSGIQTLEGSVRVKQFSFPEIHLQLLTRSWKVNILQLRIILCSVNCLQSFNYFYMIFTILEDIIYLRPEADTVDLLFSFFIHPGMNFNKQIE